MSVRRAVLIAVAACAPAPGFSKQRIDPEFRAEGITVFDVDHDGHLDLVTDQLWYAGPDFTPHELTTPQTFDVEAGYASSFGAFHMDVDGDGYDDLISFGLPDTAVKWCRNPRGADIHWDCFTIHPDEFEESPTFAPGLGLLMGVGNPRVLGWMTPGADPTQPWVMHPISGPDFAPSNHGLGFADVDGDGRADLLTGEGWFAQPADPTTPWTFHATGWCPDNCAHMFTYDFNGDGRLDVIGTSPHNYGTWWWEQAADGSFVQHVIDEAISEEHSAQLVDLDGDGVPELVTGKRYWAHFDRDAGALDPVLLVIYRFHLVDGEVVWNRELLDDGVGVGSHNLEVVDLDGNGKLDLAFATRKGVYVYLQD